MAYWPMKLKLVLVIVLLCFGTAVSARLTSHWDFELLTERASLIVIATPTKVTETTEHIALPDIVTQYPDGRKENVMVNGMETTFEVLAVLKGPSETKELTLHYYALAAGEVPGEDAARLVSFEPKDKKRFLMFLVQEPDGRYMAVNGQTDPRTSIQQFAVGQYP